MELFTETFIVAIQNEWIDNYEAAEIIKLIAGNNQEGILSILTVNYKRHMRNEIEHLISLLPIRQV